MQVIADRPKTVFNHLNQKILKSFNKLIVPVLWGLSGRLRELKNKGKVQVGNPKSGRDCLRELFITKFKSQLCWP